MHERPHRHPCRAGLDGEVRRWGDTFSADSCFPRSSSPLMPWVWLHSTWLLGFLHEQRVFQRLLPHKRLFVAAGRAHRSSSARARRGLTSQAVRMCCRQPAAGTPAPALPAAAGAASSGAAHTCSTTTGSPPKMLSCCIHLYWLERRHIVRVGLPNAAHASPEPGKVGATHTSAYLFCVNTAVWPCRKFSTTTERVPKRKRFRLSAQPQQQQHPQLHSVCYHLWLITSSRLHDCIAVKAIEMRPTASLSAGERQHLVPAHAGTS